MNEHILDKKLKNKNVNSPEYSQLLLPLILSSVLLQRRLLPGHHHWHGTNYEHVHGGAVWRHSHGESSGPHTSALVFLSS